MARYEVVPMSELVASSQHSYMLDSLCRRRLIPPCARRFSDTSLLLFILVLIIIIISRGTDGPDIHGEDQERDKVPAVSSEVKFAKVRHDPPDKDSSDAETTEEGDEQTRSNVLLENIPEIEGAEEEQEQPSSNATAEIFPEIEGKGEEIPDKDGQPSSNATSKSIPKVESQAEETADEEEGQASSNITAKISLAIEGLKAKCPRWTHDFARQYQQVCGYWLKQFTMWEKQVNTAQPGVGFWCDGKNCGGWGDQEAGIITAFGKAVAQKKRFSLFHIDPLEKIFSPCLFKTSATNWALDASMRRRAALALVSKNGTNDSDRPLPSSCVETTSNSLSKCGTWLETSCASGTDVNVGNRACLPSNSCSSMAGFYMARKGGPRERTKARRSTLSHAQTMGCILRANFEPSEFLRSGFELPFRFRNNTRNLTTDAIVQLMKDHFVISIHVRLGDVHFSTSEGDANLRWYENQHLLDSFKCASTVEAFERRAKDRIGNKNVMWFLSSDSYTLRQMAGDLFPDRVAYLDMKPTHVGFDQSTKAIQASALSRTMAEWFLLGHGDEMVEEGDSAFMRTTWVAHLKNTVFNAKRGRCHAEYFRYDLDWASFAESRICRKTYNEHDRLPQPHLSLMPEYGREAWVDYRSQQVTTTSQFFG